MKALLIVAAGSSIGGVSRYGMQLLVYRLYPIHFPLGTLLVNIIGCLLIGVFFALAEKSNILSPETRLFLITGFCGGFTTFSSFSLENIGLLRSGELLYFFIYLSGSVVLGILATFLGIYLVKPS